ncbi:hypothetical protein [Hydrogenophaga pseudoflava]|uniref:Uncharacterized protein n=1 Tax=Hydrogenophaga pseudoflava TaxID=47421 RepID=A0A4P6X4I0_HYDPS|nr:hypothetical protein [Hydrogenophaga pseudoflava]QBM29765.1 hypothetical protein HPF_18880 [Hydrogenophaga pseudoflava]
MAQGEHQPDGTISTWLALESFGFQPDKSVFPNDGSAMSIDLGSFKLSAARMPNLMLVDVVAFTGLYRSPRTIASIEFDMPTTVSSIEQGAAWIAWHLQKQLPSRETAFSLKQAAFVLLGLKHLDTLPWVQRAASYERRPRCWVERSWMRQALRQLCKNLEGAVAEDMVTIAFDSRILTFSGRDWVVPMPAKGETWVSEIQIPAVNLTSLPARLNDEDILVSIWDDGLCIGNRLFKGAVPVDKDTHGEVLPTFTTTDSQP